MNPLDNNSPFNGPLTPHHFRQKNDSAKNGPQATTTTKFAPIKYAPIAIAGLALLVLPLTVWQINTQQDIRQRASEGRQTPVVSNVIAKFNGADITDADIDLEYTKQQGATVYTVTPSGLKEDILNDVIRKKIIEKEANARNIAITDTEIENKISILKNIAPTTAGNRELVNDLLLEEKLAALVANAVILNLVISSSNSAQEESFFQLIRNEALEQESLLTVAVPYARQSRNLTVIENTAVTTSHMLLSPEASEIIFSLEVTEISEIIQSNERLIIAEVLSTTLGEYENFEDFINEKKLQEVQIL